MQISFVMLIFLLFLNQFFGGRGKFTGQIALGKRQQSAEQNTEMSCFQRES